MAGAKLPAVIAGVPTIHVGKGPTRIWCFGDVHIGAKEHDWRLWGKHLARAEAEGWRGVCVGDLCEMVGLHDKVALFGALWEQDKKPPEQMREGIRDLSRIHLDAAVEGNHDWRLAKGHGVSAWDDVMLPQIRSKTRPAKYLGVGGYLRYVRGDDELILCVSHGEGPVTNPMTTLYRMMLVWPDARAYVTGHTHHLFASEHAVEGLGDRRPKLLVRTGTYLGFADYAKRRLLGQPVMPLGSVLLTWNTDGSLSSELLT